MESQSVHFLSHEIFPFNGKRMQLIDFDILIATVLIAMQWSVVGSTNA